MVNLLEDFLKDSMVNSFRDVTRTVSIKILVKSSINEDVLNFKASPQLGVPRLIERAGLYNYKLENFVFTTTTQEETQTVISDQSQLFSYHLWVKYMILHEYMVGDSIINAIKRSGYPEYSSELGFTFYEKCIYAKILSQFAFVHGLLIPSKNLDITDIDESAGLMGMISWFNSKLLESVEYNVNFYLSGIEPSRLQQLEVKRGNEDPDSYDYYNYVTFSEVSDQTLRTVLDRMVSVNSKIIFSLTDNTQYIGRMNREMAKLNIQFAKCFHVLHCKGQHFDCNYSNDPDKTDIQELSKNFKRSKIDKIYHKLEPWLDVGNDNFEQISFESQASSDRTNLFMLITGGMISIDFVENISTKPVWFTQLNHDPDNYLLHNSNKHGEGNHIPSLMVKGNYIYWNIPIKSTLLNFFDLEGIPNFEKDNLEKAFKEKRALTNRSLIIKIGETDKIADYKNSSFNVVEMTHYLNMMKSKASHVHDSDHGLVHKTIDFEKYPDIKHYFDSQIVFDETSDYNNMLISAHVGLANYIDRDIAKSKMFKVDSVVNYFPLVWVGYVNPMKEIILKMVES